MVQKTEKVAALREWAWADFCVKECRGMVRAWSFLLIGKRNRPTIKGYTGVVSFKA